MTPEEITKLARQIAESEWPIDAYGQPASQRCAARITPILTAKLAAREAEYERLREAAELCDKFYSYHVSAWSTEQRQAEHLMGLLYRYEAITPQQEQGK